MTAGSEALVTSAAPRPLRMTAKRAPTAGFRDASAFYYSRAPPCRRFRAAEARATRGASHLSIRCAEASLYMLERHTATLELMPQKGKAWASWHAGI